MDTTTRNRTTDVLISGAGPTGLMLATVLAKLGVDHILFDGKSGPTTESRALGVQARTLEIYEQLGIVDEVLTNGTRAVAISPGFRKRVFATIPFVVLGATFTKYPFMQIFEQNRNERLLGDELRRLGGEVLWNHALEGLEVAESGDHPVEATLSGGVTVTARYVVGADGASSPVRRMRDIGFEGTTSAHTFYVIDAADLHGLPNTSINVRLGPTDFLLGFPMRQGQDARLVGVVPGEQSADTTANADAPLRERIAGFGVTWGTTNWLSTYQVHHRVAEKFRDGPVFLAGDAAHVHSPVGAQGMNTGLQDAHNLACKLADVLQGRADDSYLDRYDAERRPVAKHIISFTERMFETAITDSRVRRFVVRTLLPVVAPIIAFLMPRVPLGRRLFGYLSQTRIHYPMLPAKQDARGRRDPVVGRRLPPFADNHEPLRTFTWQVHAYGAVEPSVAAAVEVATGLPVHAYPAPEGTPLRGGWMYLVRPDGFVAAAGVTAEPLVSALPWGSAAN